MLHTHHVRQMVRRCETKTRFFPAGEAGTKRSIDNKDSQGHCNYSYNYNYKNRQTRLWRVLQTLLLIDVRATAIVDRKRHDSRTANTGHKNKTKQQQRTHENTDSN